MATKQAQPAGLSIITKSGIVVQPAVVSIGEFERFKEAVAEVAAFYDGYVVTAATVSADRNVRTQLNKFIEGIENKRKAARAEVLKPYDDFKVDYDEAMAPVIKVRDEIKAQIDEYDQHVKDVRLSVVADVFKQLADAGGFNPDDFKVYHAEFQKAEHFKKDKFELTTKAIGAINEIFDKEVARLEEITQGRETIKQMAEANGLIAAPYLTIFDEGRTLPQVIQTITNDAQAAKMEREAQAAREAAEVARLEEIRAKASQDAAGKYTVVDNETGEVIDTEAPAQPEEQKQQQPQPHEKQPARLVLEMEFEDVGEIRELKAWLEAHGVKYTQKEAVLL